MSATIDTQTRPASRNDFTTAIVCALAEEATPVQALFDKNFDRYSKFYGRATGDRNVYFNGLLGGHNVVLSYLPDMGTRGAAATLASLRTSYTELQLVLVVGICGGVPSGPNPKSPQRYLGDVIIADKLFVYGYGKQTPGEFKHTNPFRTHNDEAKALLKSLEGEDNLAFFREQFAATVNNLVNNRKAWCAPDAKTDVVYQPSYHHKHRDEHAHGCSCSAADAICDAATKTSCEELECASSEIIRTRADVEDANIFIGPMASADTVMRAGETREALAEKGEVIGFEMEGSGAWDGAVPCVIVKGITDYADSHKNKKWRLYAAATGAAAAKTFLDHWNVQTKSRISQYWMVSVDRNADFAGRNAEIEQLRDFVSSPDGPKVLAMYGLGGIGKTQIALELSYRMKSELSVFWIQCSSIENIEKSYIDAAEMLGMVDVNQAQAKETVNVCLSNRATKWLLILDNVDDLNTWVYLKQNLPLRKEWRILITTRNGNLAAQTARSHVLQVHEPGKQDAIDILCKRLIPEIRFLLDDKETVLAVLDRLESLPLALVQAAAFLNVNRKFTLANYLEIFNRQEPEVVEFLGKDFADHGHDGDGSSPVATTWLVSYRQLMKINDTAAIFLRIMAFVDPHDIPDSFLPADGPIDEVPTALSLLAAFSFITTKRGRQDYSTMHRLVRLATRSWARQDGEFPVFLEWAADRLEETYSSSDERSRRQYLPHAISLISENEFDGARHPYLLRRTAYGLSMDHRNAEALELYTKIMYINKTELGDRHPDTLRSMACVASEHQSLFQLDEAEKLGMDAFTASKEALGPNHPDTIFTAYVISAICKVGNKHDKLLELHPQLVDILQNTTELHIPGSVQSVTSIANSYMQEGRLKEAEDLLSVNLKIHQETHGMHHSDSLEFMNDLVRLYTSQSRLQEAYKMITDIIKTCNHDYDLYPRLLITSEVNMANIHVKLQEEQQAEEVATRAVKEATERLGPRDADTLHAMAALASVRQLQERWEDAENLLLAALEGAREKHGSNHFLVSTAIMRLSGLYWNQGRREDATKRKDEAIKVLTREDELGPNDPQTLENIYQFVLKGNPNDYYLQLMTRVVGLANNVLGPNDLKTKEYTSFLSTLQEKIYAGKATMAAIPASTPESSLPVRGRRRDRFNKLFGKARQALRSSSRLIREHREPIVDGDA